MRDEDYCEYCKKELEFDTIDISFGFGSKFDGKRFLFCSDGCLWTWLKENSFVNHALEETGGKK